MKILKLLTVLLITLSIVSCKDLAEDKNYGLPAAMDASTVYESANFSPPALASSESMDYSTPPPHEASGYYAGQGNTSSEPIPVPVNNGAEKKKVIKNGNIDIKANDVGRSKKAMDLLLKKFNAHYDLEEYHNNDQSSSYTLKIRVPCTGFESLVAGIEGGGDEVTSKSINTTDVTGEYIDTETRLTNKREYMKRYRDILQRAGSIKDVLEVEENIRVLQEEIESAESRLKYLAGQVAYSTLDVSLVHYKEFVYKAAEQPRFIERAKKSLGRGWDHSVDFVVDLISLWPFLLILSGLILIARRYIKKRREAR